MEMHIIKSQRFFKPPYHRAYLMYRIENIVFMPMIILNPFPRDKWIDTNLGLLICLYSIFYCPILTYHDSGNKGFGNIV